MVQNLGRKPLFTSGGRLFVFRTEPRSSISNETHAMMLQTRSNGRTPKHGKHTDSITDKPGTHTCVVTPLPPLVPFVPPPPSSPSSDKISHLVSAQGSKMYGFVATPDMLAAAAVAHWREGVVVGAARHLDNMNGRSKRNKKVG